MDPSPKKEEGPLLCSGAHGSLALPFAVVIQGLPLVAPGQTHTRPVPSIGLPNSDDEAGTLRLALHIC